MGLPQMSDYQAALQSPETCFIDKSIKLCRCDSNAFGIPKVASGNFALTYSLINPDKRWAVRCFHRESPGLEYRYSEISAYLRKYPNPYFAQFEYQKRGILVNGSEYPIVKMEWIYGKPINEYIGANLHNTQKLNALLTSFVNCVRNLKENGISHGDLQHGNILICNDKVVLVDYDGVYVPGLRLNSSPELGHVNYQHPLRDESVFGNFVDRFSAIVIYMSIRALIISPKLWDQFENGDNLIFVRKDYIDPENSKLIRELSKINELSSLLNIFIKICHSSFRSIPEIDDFVNSKQITFEAPSTPDIGKKPIRNRQYVVISSINSKELIENAGNVVEVVGRITEVKLGKTKYGKPYYFMNFGDYRQGCFKIVIWSEAITNITRRGVAIETYDGKWISIVGLISSYKGAPEIEIQPGSKINILASESEAKALLNGAMYGPSQITPTPPGKRPTTITTTPNQPGDPNSIAAKNARVLRDIGRSQSISHTSPGIQQPQQVNSPAKQVPSPQYSSSSQKGQYSKKDACYIATAIYGSYDHPKVIVLRAFRDEILIKHNLGRIFVHFYYKVSPKLVKRYGKNKALCKVTRVLLDIITKAICIGAKHAK